MKIEEFLKTSGKLTIDKKIAINLQLSAAKGSGIILCALKKFDISTQQFNVLRILRGQKGKPANLSTIQDRMVHKMSNTTRLVDKLIDKKLVARTICKNNRRKVEILITENGLQLLKKIDPIVDGAEADITQNLTAKEKEILNKILEKLRT